MAIAVPNRATPSRHTAMQLQPAKQLALLISLGHDLLALRDMDQLLDHALARVLEYTGYDSGSVLLYDEPQRALTVRATIGGEVARGTTVPNLQRSIAGHVFTSGRPLVLEGHGENIGITWRDYTRDIPSVVCLPMLVTESRTIGVLVLKSSFAARPLDPADLDALQLLTAQLAAVVENARLHSERSRLLDDLAQREQQLQELLGKLLTAQEEERRRVAYDLHDGLAQVAAGAYQHLQALAAQYRPRAPKARAELHQALELSRRTVREARYMMASLRPTALDDLGLSVAIRLEIEALWANGWEITFEEISSVGRLPSLIETALFRVAQEALANVRKHAATTRASVTLERTDSEVVLTVQDWGVGFQMGERGPQRKRGDQMGLISIQERVSLLGGRCCMTSAPNEGTTVLARVPVTR